MNLFNDNQLNKYQSSSSEDKKDKVNDIDGYFDRSNIEKVDQLAEQIATRLGTINKKPILASIYSKIPTNTLIRYSVEAAENGRNRPALYMWKVAQLPQWAEWKKKHVHTSET